LRQEYDREKRYVGASGWKRSDTFREEKAPKGESQERRRCETEPAGVRREETVERVAKP
jgi:predicted nucleic acid-binding Zn ribbon protein